MKKIISLTLCAIAFIACSEKEKTTSASNDEGASINAATATPQTSSGYTSDTDYSPTVDSRGDYHTIDGRGRQVQYQGSYEQQRDLDLIDAYLMEYPEY